jgi:hypothetical protein
MPSSSAPSVMTLRDLRSSAVGLLAAALMFVGDVLLYGPYATSHPATVYFDHIDPTAPAAALLASPMAETHRLRAIAGGLLGPLAGLLYIIAGIGQFVRSEYGVAGWLAAIGHSVSMVVVASYHAAYPYTAFIAKAYHDCEATNAQPEDLSTRLLRPEDVGYGQKIQQFSCKPMEGVMQDHAAYMAAMKTVVGRELMEALKHPIRLVLIHSRTHARTHARTYSRAYAPVQTPPGQVRRACMLARAAGHLQRDF